MGGSSAMTGRKASARKVLAAARRASPNTMNKQSMAAVIQQLGISPDELGSLKGEMASGGLSPDDMQELCLHFAASN